MSSTEYSPQRRGDAEEHIKEEDEIKTRERRGGRERGGSAAALGASAQDLPATFLRAASAHDLRALRRFSQIETTRALRLWSLAPLRPLPPQRSLSFDFDFCSSQRLRVSAVNLCGEMMISSANAPRLRALRRFSQIGTTRTLRLRSFVPLRPLPPQRPLSFKFGFSQRLSVSAVNLYVEMVIS